MTWKSEDDAEVFSAGSAPASEILALARATREQKDGIGTAVLRTKSMRGFLGQRVKEFAIPKVKAARFELVKPGAKQHFTNG